MRRLNRRALLVGGTFLGGLLAIAKDFRFYREQAKLKALAQQQIQGSDQAATLNAALEADAEKIYQGQAVIESLQLTPPQRPYDRNISKRLIQCSKIATQQYLTGKTIPDYDGNIASLPAFTDEFADYTQIASFRGVEVNVSESVEVELSPPQRLDSSDQLDQSVSQAESQITDTLKKVVKISQKIPVYLGFVLTSPEHSLIVFRGTQTEIEWFNNLRAQPKLYTDPTSGQSFGRIHDGFIKNYQRIVDPIPRKIAEQLDPNVPCYITGHSLGASLAVLCALDLAVNVPALQSRLELYTYASPRVGNPTFAQIHSRLVPNSYRVVNLADVIPLLPPTQAIGTYAHVGQAWSFLAQMQDIMPNHVVDTYKSAVDARVEMDQARSYPLSALL